MREDGFTLVELLVGMIVMLIVFFAAMGLFQVAQSNQPEIQSQNDRIQQAQVGMERLVQELRQSSSVISATGSSLTVNTYLQGTTCAGGATATARSCRVTYTCSSGTCTRTPSELNGNGAGTTERFATGLASNAIFTYSPNSTAPTLITVTMAFQESPGSAETVTLSDGAALRNVSGAVGS